MKHTNRYGMTSPHNLLFEKKMTKLQNQNSTRYKHLSEQRPTVSDKLWKQYGLAQNKGNSSVT